MGSWICLVSQVGPYQYVESIYNTKAQGHGSFQGWISLEATPGDEFQYQLKCTLASKQSNKHKEATKSHEEE